MQIPPPQIRFSPTPRQHEAWQAIIKPEINEVLYGGGAGGGKSLFGCAWEIISSQLYPGTRWLMGRRELKRLRQSTMATLFDLLSKWKFIKDRDYTFNSQHGLLTFANLSEIIMMDLAPIPSDPNYERLGSVEITGGFIDEASEVEEKAKEIVLSRTRYKLEEYGLTPKILLTCNPHKGYLYREFYKPSVSGQLPPDKKFIRSLVTDNPHVSPHYIKQLQKLKDKVLKARLLQGDWEYADDENSLFVYDAISDMFTNTLDDDKTQYLTCDVARFGRDKAVIMRWEGMTVVEIITYDKSSMPTLETEILVLAGKYHIPMSHVLVDEDGVGGGIVDHLKCKGFVGNASAVDDKTDREMRETEYKVNFQNMRSQCYYTLSEYINDRIIAIRTDSYTIQEAITEELEQIKAIDVDKDTKFRVISKDDIKAAIGRSPDFADTLMMRMYYIVKPEKKRARVFGSNPLA